MTVLDGAGTVLTGTESVSPVLWFFPPEPTHPVNESASTAVAINEVALRATMARMMTQSSDDRTTGGQRAKIPRVHVYALTSSQLLHETLDLFLTKEAAERELREILLDEPDWRDVLRVVPILLDDRNVSPN